MARFLPVYEAFERGVRGLGLPGCDDGDGDGEEEEVVVNGLRRMYMKEMERTERLRGDVERILGNGKGWRTVREQGQPMLLENGQELQRPLLLEFVAHIHASVEGEPHLLLAYTWVLYMALFSGGRYIRSRLRQAGIGFWERRVEGEKDKGSYGGRRMANSEKGDAVDAYLGFWTFEGDEDGEDLKAEFKARFASVEDILTEAEKGEVVQEAVFIMQSITEVVVEIGEVVGTSKSAAAGLFAAELRADWRVDGREEDEPSMRWLLLKHVLPMGMVELIAAGARSAVSAGMVPLFWSARAR